jgi:hypothetical protein
MIKALTEANREDKGEFDPASLRAVRVSGEALRCIFPSYFRTFRISKHFLMLLMNTARVETRRNQKHGIAPAAAIMAIV